MTWSKRWKTKKEKMDKFFTLVRSLVGGKREKSEGTNGSWMARLSGPLHSAADPADRRREPAAAGTATET